MTQNLIGHVPYIGNGSALKTFSLLGIMEAMKSPGGRDLVGCDPARPEPDETVAGVIANNLDYKFVYHLEDEPITRQPRVCYDEQGPWPPVSVDPFVAKHCDIRIAKAEAKRERKKLKRLAAAGRV